LQAYGDPPPDLADLAASLAFDLARNRPLVDGNKRTAHVCYRTFLALNGATINTSDEDQYVTNLALAEGSLPEADFATWLRQHFRREPGNEVHEKPAGYGRCAGKTTRRPIPITQRQIDSRLTGRSLFPDTAVGTVHRAR